MGSGSVFLGWNVGGTSSSAVVADAAANILEREGWPSLAQRGPAAMIADFMARAERMLARYPIDAIGVSIGGPLDTSTGTVLSPPHLPGWDGVPLAAMLRENFHRDVFVEHDAAACLLAEWLWGAAKGLTHVAYLTCGTGCGAGLMIGGRIVRGPKGQTPELGHVRLAPEGPEAFGKRGCVESFCSGAGISKLAPFMFPERFSSPTGPERLKALADSGDSAAKAVLDEAARRTGQLCAILADIFAPQAILLGSLGRYLGPAWVAKIEEAFREEALPSNSRHTVLRLPGLGERLQDLSAVAPAVVKGACG